jgi:hypothetical protein
MRGEMKICRELGRARADRRWVDAQAAPAEPGRGYPWYVLCFVSATRTFALDYLVLWYVYRYLVLPTVDMCLQATAKDVNPC